MKDLNTDLSKKEKTLEQISTKDLEVVYAFVTFNRSLDRDLAFDTYHKRSLYAWLFHSDKLKLKDKLLQVRAAPEPSVIIWENLQYSRSDRNRRRLLTTFFSLILVILSLAMIFSSKFLEEKTSNNGYKSSTVCPLDFTVWAIPEQQSYVNENPQYLHCYCDEYNELEQAKDELCRSYLKDQVNSQVLIYFASFMVLLVNFLMTKVLRVWSVFEKHHTGK
jgi:hypothetical protein